MVSLNVNDDIELRVFDEKDAGEIFKVVRENYEHLRPFLHWATEDYSLESAREFIGQTQSAFAETGGQTYGIFCNQQFAGIIGFINFSRESRRTEIGYWLAKNYEGKGIITKACKVLINYAFDELDMNRIEIRCATENARSRAIPERLNFKLDGVLRQAEWRHTRFFDMAIYSLLADEREKI